MFLGRLHPKKGLDILARSFAGMPGRFDDAMLLVVGPDKFGTRKNMEAILRSKGLLDRTVFTGLLTGEDKLAALRCADLSCCRRIPMSWGSPCWRQWLRGCR